MQIPVDVPWRHVVVTASSVAQVGIARIGEPIVITYKLSASFLWTRISDDQQLLNFRYEVIQDSDVWLLAGKAASDFSIKVRTLITRQS